MGVSTDTHETQCAFAEKTGADFPMVGDADHRISDAYGVAWPLLGIDRRVTFFIDGDGIVRGIFKHALDVGAHVSDAIAMLRRQAPRA